MFNDTFLHFATVKTIARIHVQNLMKNIWEFLEE